VKAGKTRGRLIALVKIAVSAGLLGYLVLRVDWGQAATLLANADSTLIALAPTVYFAAFGFGAVRWRRILADSTIRFSLGQCYGGYLVGQFYGVVLPGAIGGDVIRIGRCATRSQCSVGEATMSVLLERLCGIIALAALFVLSPLPTHWEMTSAGDEHWLTAARAITAAGGIALLAALLTRRLWSGWLARRQLKGLWAFLASGNRLVGNLRTASLVLVLATSALFQFCDIIITYVLSRAIGLAIPLRVFFVVMPIVYFATVLPISLGGLGIRETTLAFLLSRFGVGGPEAVLLAFLVYLGRAAVGMLGGIAHISEILLTRRALHRCRTRDGAQPKRSA